MSEASDLGNWVDIAAGVCRWASGCSEDATEGSARLCAYHRNMRSNRERRFDYVPDVTAPGCCYVDQHRHRCGGSAYRTTDLANSHDTGLALCLRHFLIWTGRNPRDD